MTVDEMDKIIVAATQISGAGLPPSGVSGFCFRAEQAIELAAAKGANLVVLPEQWSTPYFGQSRDARLMGLASEVENSILVRRMIQLAKLYAVVLVVPLYEQRNQALFSSVCVIDSDGTMAGMYRASHVRDDGPGCYDKLYFAPGDTGFKVVTTTYCNVGVAVGHDLWYPECARALALQGADVIVYPVAIRSDTRYRSGHWQRTLQGHAAANMVPVICSNRHGTEILSHEDGTEEKRAEFGGRSFITDVSGAILVECAAYQHGSGARSDIVLSPVMIVTAEIDVLTNRRERLEVGLFRDRRPDLYGSLLTKDGVAGKS